jgi:hypothetical protein
MWSAVKNKSIKFTPKNQLITLTFSSSVAAKEKWGNCKKEIIFPMGKFLIKNRNGHLMSAASYVICLLYWLICLHQSSVRP